MDPESIPATLDFLLQQIDVDLSHHSHLQEIRSAREKIRDFRKLLEEWETLIPNQKPHAKFQTIVNGDLPVGVRLPRGGE
jgi:hypothetical protein